jgi:hypothetical protein
MARSNVRPSGKRSGFEETIGKQLDDAGMRYEYEAFSYEYDVPLRKNRAKCVACGSTDLVRTAWYTPDFFLENGIIVEAKGRFTAANRRLINAVREDHPELMENLVMVFMRDNKIHKNSKTTYSAWCEANHVPYSIGTLRPEWLRRKK